MLDTKHITMAGISERRRLEDAGFVWLAGWLAGSFTGCFVQKVACGTHQSMMIDSLLKEAD